LGRLLFEMLLPPFGGSFTFSWFELLIMLNEHTDQSNLYKYNTHHDLKHTAPSNDSEEWRRRQRIWYLSKDYFLFHIEHNIAWLINNMYL
jgi:hypothetical protein